MSSRGTTPSDEDDVEQMIDEGGVMLLKCNEDDISFRIAAERSRLPFDRPTEHELAFFPELWQSRSSVDVFLFIRNIALKKWLENPLDELGIADLRSSIPAPFNSDVKLIENIHQYLMRNGLINTGAFRRTSGIPKMLPRNERKVVVIGAGVAGLSAALQLITYGFDVTILEAKNQIGGRVSSIKVDGEVMEIGADTIRSARSNPMTVLIQQLNVEPVPVNEHASFYENGKMVEQIREKAAMGLYTGLRDALDFLCHQASQKEENGQYVSRQRGIENIINIAERNTLVGYYNYWKLCADLAAKRAHNFEQMKICRDIAVIAEKRLNSLDDSDLLLRRSLKRDIQNALARFDEEAAAMEKCELNLKNFKNYPYTKHFIHPQDFNKFNFFLGHEELVFGAPLEKVQLSCDAVKNRMPGASLRFKEGVSELLVRLVNGRNMDIRLEHVVTDIDYNGDDVVLNVKNKNNEVEKIEANFCVCTLPLGVLKKSIVNDEKAPKFVPPLPEKKVEAVRNMGFGLINKIVMVFDKAFWENGEKYFFSTAPTSIKGRGEMIIWQTVPNSRVLTTYLAGMSAELVLPEEVIVSKAMDILTSIFPACPRMPKKVKITKYQDDEFCFGGFSFMSLRTEMHHYEDLIEPLKSQESGKKIIYFAGEHTSSSYAGSLQGAWLSGIRASSDLINDVYGLNFVNFGDDVEVMEEVVMEELRTNGNGNGVEIKESTNEKVPEEEVEDDIHILE